jgi:hypothetical protein
MFNIAHGGTISFVIFPGIPGFYWVATDGLDRRRQPSPQTKKPEEAYFSGVEEAAFASSDVLPGPAGS